MPVDMKRYPKNWKSRVEKVRIRAKGRCECTGECGTHHGRCNAENYEPHPITGSKVILTTAHLGVKKQDGSAGDKHDKMDCRMKNLKHMCQRCHLLFDLPEHMENARKTRRLKILKAGQLELPLDSANQRD